MSLIETALKKAAAAGASKPLELAKQLPVRAAAPVDLESTSKIEQLVKPGDGLEITRRMALPEQSLIQQQLLYAASENRTATYQYRRIKRPLLANALGRDKEALARGRIISICSANSGEGKTFTALNLALNLTLEQGVKVLLVDGDVAKGGLTTALQLDDETGLLDALDSDTANRLDPYICQTDYPGLFVLGAGGRRPDATELLSGTRMAHMFDDLLRREPELLIVFDSPPLLLTTEARALVSVAGQIVLVVRAGVTRREAVTRAVEALGNDRYCALLLNHTEPSEEENQYYGDNAPNRKPAA